MAKISKLHIIINKLIDGVTQKIVASEVGVTQGYVSTIKKRLDQLKYKPLIYNNEVCCLECEKKTDLVFHHDHNTGQPIAILCRGCNTIIGNQTVFEKGILTNNGFEKGLMKNGTTIQIPKELVNVFLDKWYTENPLRTDMKLTHILKDKMINYINNDDEKWY